MSNQVEGNIAIVALLVSLVALLVTATQLLLQLFNSADGYRRCSASVIDVWHKKRRRRWKWSEFRFETQYVTPQIVLVTPQEYGIYDRQYGNVFMINSPSLQHSACQELNITVHQDYCYMRSAPRQPMERIREHSSAPDIFDLEKAGNTVASKNHRLARVRTDSDSLVSWLRLISDLHCLSHSYWPLDCSQCTANNIEKNHTGVIRSKVNSVRDDFGDEYSNAARSDIAVMYRTRSWDFMPPDIIRPLAGTNVGDIIVLAIRMGMKWRSLEPEIGKMQADGNGFNLTSTDIRGLGTVLRFTSVGSHEAFPRIVPSRAGDKMLFGIVPGDPVLVRKDLPLIGNDGKVGDLARIGELLNLSSLVCGSPKDANAEVFNDTIALLLPFLPLEGSTITSYCFPVWRIEGFHKGIHFYCESRLAFHRRLRIRVKEGLGNKDLSRTLVEVLDYMDKFEQDHSDYWYSRWFWNPSIREKETWQDRLAAIQNMRQAFQWTTDYFVKKGFDRAHIDGCSRYLHLVAANALMASHATEAVKTLQKNSPGPCTHEDQRKAYDITDRHGYFFGSRQYEMGQLYVDYSLDPAFSVSAHLRQRCIVDLDMEQVEAAWWVLQLRGIIWSISTWHPNGTVQKTLGSPVPSSFYGNKTPVWIT